MNFDQAGFDGVILRKLSAIIHCGQLKKKSLESADKDNKNQRLLFEDMFDFLLADLFELTTKAQEENLDIPYEVACLVIGYEAGQQHAKGACNLLSKPMGEKPVKDSISSYIGYAFYLDQLIDGHRKGRADRLEGLTAKVKGTVNFYLVDTNRKNIKAKDYGYILGFDSDKLKVGRCIECLSYILAKSKASVKILSRGYGISEKIKGYNKSLLTD
ncbi:hypothetical protein [Shewanella frigidimarina]|uniref:hypothetical protein n=1 Tax=Shewanella frigidimarina TaxID=56812 RepID=UPI003D78BF2A